MFLKEKPPSPDWPSLEDLLRFDSVEEANALSALWERDVFSDAFLLKASPLYRRLRQTAAERGVRLVSQDPAVFNAVPLCSLPDILRTRTVPVLRNRPALQEIACRMGDRITGYHLARIGSPGNVILHELAHILAHEALMPGVDPVRLLEGLPAQSLHERVALMFGCEAVASAVEVIVGYEVLKSGFNATSLFFLRQSTYFYLDRVGFEALHGFEDVHGLGNVFEVLWLGYFGALSRNPVMARAGEQQDSLGALTDAFFAGNLPSEAAQVLKICDQLNENFRNNVTEFFFAFQGMTDAEIETLAYAELPGVMKVEIDRLRDLGRWLFADAVEGGHRS